MFKVIISNSKVNKTWTGLNSDGTPFSTEQNAQTWLDRQIGKPHRLPERVVSIDSQYDQDDVIEIIETEVDEVMTQTHVRLRAEYTSEIVNISTAYNAEQDKINKIKAGASARQACQNVLDFIAGVNLDRNLTSEQITQMQTSFASIQLSLQAFRPSLAKSLIQAVIVDGIIVTQALKDGCLSLLSNY